MTDRSIVVIGAGIVGASLAYHLTGHGRPVTLIDAGLPGSGATRASFAWIGRPVSSDLPSAPLRYLALDDYRRLEAELPELSIRWSGSLTWDGFDDTPWPSTGDVEAIEPHLLDPPAAANHHPEDAAIDPVAASELLTAAARDRGARVLTGTTAIALAHRAGIGVTLPVEPPPAVLVRLRATPGLVRAIVATPSMEFRQLDDGTILAPTAYSGETDQAALLATARRVRDRFAASFAGAGGTEVISAEIGWRPMPTDGEPVIGPPAGTQGLYVAVMHSAITLAAAVGRLAASEILTARPAPELAGCRPTRFH
jgi:glycine/D-amino acid oxidase-like deaminating enzyme